MDAGEYQRLAERTSDGKGLTLDPLLAYRCDLGCPAASGLGDLLRPLGRAAEAVKKFIGHGHPIDPSVIGELPLLLPTNALRCALLDLVRQQPGRVETVEERVQVGMLGLVGESLELYELLSGAPQPGHADKVTKELSDVAWYLADLCSALRLDLGKVMEANIAKLKARYPDGFSPERSLNRSEGGGG